MVEEEMDYSSSTKSQWYHGTCHKYQTQLESGNYMLHPLTLYIDKTGTDRIMKNSLEPLVCTSTILTTKARQDTNNWFVIGFIPNMEDPSTLDKKANGAPKKPRSLTVRDYHRCLSVLIDPIVGVQGSNPVMSFRRGGDVARFQIICPIATVMGDNLSNNKLCGKAANTTASCVRMSRCCLTGYGETDKLPHTCTLIEGEVVHKLSLDALGCCHGYSEDLGQSLGTTGEPLSPNLRGWLAHLETLTPKEKESTIILRKLREDIAESVLKDVYGTHSVVNAFSKLDFGVDSNIHQCTMADLMHSVEEGIFKHVIECILGLLPGSQKARVNRLVAQWFTLKGSNRSGERPNYPRVSFTRGFCTETLLSADERVGQLFVIALLLITKQGKDIMQARFDPDFDTSRAKRQEQQRQEQHTRKEPQQQASRKKRKNANEEHVVQQSLPTHHRLSDQPRGNATGTTIPDPKLSKHEQEDLLDAIGMGYLNTHCMPSLPVHHQRILQRYLDKTLTKTHFERISKGLKLPDEFMAYQTFELGRQRAGPRSPFIPGIDRDIHSTASIFPSRRLRDAGLTLRLSMQDTAKLVEQLLAFHAFAKYGGSLLVSHEAMITYQTSFNTMMDALKQGIKREGKNHGFKIQKFLECSHFLQDHLRHGPTVGHNSDTGERGLKQWGKKVAVTAQKRTDKVFKGQVARNTQEVEIMEILELSSKLRLNKQGRGVAAVDVPINTPPVMDGPLMGAAGKNFIFEMTAGGSSIRRGCG